MKIGLVYFTGLIQVLFLYVSIYLIEYFMDFFILYSYPIGYVFLVFLIIGFIPIVCGVLFVMNKHYLLKVDEKVIPLNFWYYGSFLAMIVFTFQTFLSYTPMYVQLIAMFTIVSMLIGLVVSKL